VNTQLVFQFWERYDRRVRAAELSLTPVFSAALARQWVRQYYAYEDLPFNAAVEEGISRLLESPRFGWFFELSFRKKAIGYAVVTRAFDYEFGGEFGIVTDFFILKAHRRQGHGSRVLELIEQFCRSQGFRSLDLYVLNRNASVCEFYLRRGFRELADRRPMTKSLSASGPATGSVSHKVQNRKNRRSASREKSPEAK
jgi:GNAT superfamily N-acetyltransferase